MRINCTFVGNSFIDISNRAYIYIYFSLSFSLSLSRCAFGSVVYDRGIYIYIYRLGLFNITTIVMILFLLIQCSLLLPLCVEVLCLIPIYNQATTKFAFHSNETSKDKLSII